MHATIPKGIVGGFEFTVLQRNLKELARKAMKMCLRVLKKSNKSRFDSYIRQEQCIDHIAACTFFPTTFLEIAVYAQKRLKAEILVSNPKGDHIFLICHVALLTLIVAVVVVSLITEGIISIKQVNDFIIFCCYQVSQIQVGKPFMTQLHLM